MTLSTKEKKQLIAMLYAVCLSLGRSPWADKKERLPFHEMIFCMILKTYFGVSSRVGVSFFEEMVGLGYITKIPFSAH
jgi:hypothetical protein